MPASSGRPAESASYRGAAELLTFIASSQAGQECFARKMLTYARGYSPAIKDAVLTRIQTEDRRAVLDIVTTIAAAVGERRLDESREASEERCP